VGTGGEGGGKNPEFGRAIGSKLVLNWKGKHQIGQGGRGLLRVWKEKGIYGRRVTDSRGKEGPQSEYSGGYCGGENRWPWRKGRRLIERFEGKGSHKGSGGIAEP